MRFFWFISLVLPLTAFGQSCPPFGYAELNREGIARLVGNPDCRVHSVEDLLKRIPKDYFKHHTLMYRSRSLQGPHQADYLNPRAVVYGKDYFGQTKPEKLLVFSFNGLASQLGYNAMEFVEADRSGGPDGKHFFKYFEASFDKGVGTVSPFNPPACVRCHGNPARPIFSIYPNWPGTFGSQHHAKMEVEKFELEKYEEFKKYASTHSRYSYLPLQVMSGDSLDHHSLVNMSNGLESTLDYFNDLRVARLIRATPEYEKARYAIAGAFLECPDWPRFIPENQWRALERNLQLQGVMNSSEADQALRKLVAEGDDFRELHSWVFDFPHGNARRRPYADFFKDFKKFVGPNPFYLKLVVDTLDKQGRGRDHMDKAALRLLMEGRGLRIDHWFADLVKSTYRNHSDWLTPLKQLDPELTKYAIDVKSCGKLRELSLQAMSKFTVPKVDPKKIVNDFPNYPQIFINTCARCHSQPNETRGGIPFIPYHNPGLLAEQLRSGVLGTEILNRVTAPEGSQMPPDRMLKPNEIEEIRQFLGK